MWNSILKDVKMFTVTVIFTFLVFTNFSDALYLDSTTEICKNTSVRCLSNNTYITCVNAGAFTVLLNTQLTCPEGYICDDSVLSHPCTKEKDSDSTTKTTTSAETTTHSSKRTGSTTSQTDVVTEVTSTTKKAPRPSTAPECKKTGFWPAAKCTQYYECLSKRNLFFGYSYYSELRTCKDGKYYDTRSQVCVLPAESDC
ncbi:unnamed protein product [Phaedon cochleariae]|uniref:Chitin-binding type-2 domain-containing protein n=1 Tax=Phaedon cochleariae TaxID=80249 RepID=A0A9N9X269_PHACE|nr:unnamed protein product [Phaedon cochleariae]